MRQFTFSLIFVDFFYHSVQIDEEGVVAAAATLCIFAGCALNSSKPVVEFRVDHSFFVSIIWNNTLPIFLGHVTTPVND